MNELGLLFCIFVKCTQRVSNFDVMDTCTAQEMETVKQSVSKSYQSELCMISRRFSICCQKKCLQSFISIKFYMHTFFSSVSHCSGPMNKGLFSKIKLNK